MSFAMATAIKGYRMTPRGPGWLGKLVDILQAYSSSKGFHYVHFPQADGSHHGGAPQPTVRDGTRREQEKKSSSRPLKSWGLKGNHPAKRREKDAVKCYSR